MKGIIYRWICIPTNKCIVGSTTRPSERYKRYKYFLNKGKWSNRYLQNAYSKYGESNFIYEVLQDNVPINILRQVEDIWIGALKSRIEDKGFNVKDAGEMNRISDCIKKQLGNKLKGRTMSEETKKQISDKLKGRKLSKDRLEKMKLLPPPRLGKKATEKERQRLKLIASNKKHTKESLEKLRRNKKCKPVLIYKGDNFFEEAFSIAEAARIIKGSASQISNVLLGKYVTHKGYNFKYKQ